jgi:pilus assembly protein CpaB
MRSRTLFLLAIIMGLITTLVFAYSFSSRNKESNEPVETKEVVVSVQAIEENTLITEEMLTLVTRPKTAVHSSSLTALTDVVGKLATTHIEADEVLLAARVQSAQEVEDMVSKKITAGQRAVSIRVDNYQSVSNLIEAEDFVDIIFSQADASIEPPVKSILLYSKVRVLAIGQKMTVRDENDELVEYASVTLEMSPEDTVKLVQAHETASFNPNAASLHLTLHRQEVTTEE